MVRCRRCDLIYPDPMPYPAESVFNNPEQYFRGHEHVAKVAAYARILRKAESVLGSPGRLLDVGGGTGEALIAARELGWGAVGLEPSASFAAAARQKGVDMRTTTIENAHLESATFDLVLLGCVLAHVHEPVQILREIRRVIRTGGVLYVDTNNEAGLYFTIGNLAQRLRRRNWTINLSPTFEPYHLLGFTPRSLRYALESTGFSIYSLEHFNRPGHVSWIARMVDAVGVRVGSGSLLDAWARAI